MSTRVVDPGCIRLEQGNFPCEYGRNPEPCRQVARMLLCVDRWSSRYQSSRHYRLCHDHFDALLAVVCAGG